MKKAVGIRIIAFGFIVVLSAGTSFAVEEAKPTAAPIQDPMTAQWEKNAAPGENHKVLDVFVGQWKHTVRWRMSPEAKPVESQGTNANRWIMGKRFLYQDVKGQSMGKPFEGIGITGYDNVRGEYTSMWLDNMGTGIMTATSQFDSPTRTLKETGSFACPMTGEKDKTFRAEWKIMNTNHYTYEMYTKDKDGKEFKSLEITYKRL